MGRAEAEERSEIEMNCNDCIKRVDCRWLQNVSSALHDLAYTGRYVMASLIGDAVRAWLPGVCLGFVSEPAGSVAEALKGHGDGS